MKMIDPKTGTRPLNSLATSESISKYLLMIGFIFQYIPNIYAQKQINITQGSFLVLNGDVALVANNAAINNNGTIIPSTATIYFTGNSDTTISNITGTSTTTCSNLTIDKPSSGIALKAPVNITNALTITNGNLYTDSNLTLMSTAAGTARVAPIPIGSNIFGKASVQRYIPAQRSWRMMTAPVTNSNTIYTDWQNAGAYVVGKGMLVTAPISSLSNGIDNSIQNNYSMYSFNLSTQSFVGVANTKVDISPGIHGSSDNIGYMVFVRGDRNPANTIIPNTNITTLSSVGKLQTGSQSFSASAISGQYTLIGNPYASPLDFSKISRTNVINRFYTWDPNLNTVGGFIVLDDLDGDGIYDKSVTNSAQTTDIQSSQAFFIQTALSAPASITINESSKSSINNNLLFRPASTMPKLIVNLYLLNVDKSVTLADAALEEFSNAFSSNVDLDDAKKFGNMNENFAFVRNNTMLSMERRPELLPTDTLFLKLTSASQRDYQLKFIGQNINRPELMAYLQDSYMNTNAALDLSDTSIINFTVSADAASSNPNRFRIIFKPSSPLPITFTKVEAENQTNAILVQWEVGNQDGIGRYEIEKSNNGKNFHYASSVATSMTTQYNWVDTNPDNETNFYRIVSVGINGSRTYSAIVKVLPGGKGNYIEVYPNPIIDNTINLQINNQPKGDYIIALLNSAGETVYENKMSINGNNSTEAFSIGRKLAAGAYQLKLQCSNGSISMQKIIVQ